MSEIHGIIDSIPEPWSTDEWDFTFDDNLRQRILREPGHGLWLTQAYQVHATRLQARVSIHPQHRWPQGHIKRLSQHQRIVAWWFDVAVGIDPSAFRALLDATTDIYVFGDTSSDAIMRWRDRMHACYGLYDRAKVLINSGRVRGVAETTPKTSSERRVSANALMLDQMLRDPSAKNWTLKEWSDAINRSQSTIQQTDAWKKIMADREAQRERQKGRSAMPYDD